MQNLPVNRVYLELIRIQLCKQHAHLPGGIQITGGVTPAVILDVFQCALGTAVQRVIFVRHFGAAHTDAGRNPNVLFRIEDDIPYHGSDARPDDPGLLFVAVFQEKHKLISAQADLNALLIRHLPQNIRHLLQNRIREDIALLLINILKIIHIQKHHNAMFPRLSS